MLGSHIAGRYRLDAELGRGGMGVVYRAHDTVLHRDVAVKLLSTTGLGSVGRARLMNEARTAASLNHPNIVAVHDAGESDTTGPGDTLPYVVMELLDGPTLQDRRPQSLDEILEITRQLCAALGHAHERDIIHRDLKPENIMLVGDGTVKLMDFGLARSLATRMTAEGTIMGTLFYMAPEMVMGQEVDGRADLYALGIMLYEMAAGRLPFEADNPVAILTQHLHAPVVPPSAHNPALPLGLDRLIVRLMAKEPDKRPASAVEVLAALDRPDRAQVSAEKSRPFSTLERIVRGRLVGREQEMAEARIIWGQAVAGRGQVLLVSGEPGVGKTRLVDELITQACVSGGRVLSGASYAEGGFPYAPFRKILRETLKDDASTLVDLADDILADLLTLAPELRSRYPELPERKPGDPLEDQRRLLDNITHYFNLLSNRSPLLLVLEDVHWADSGTITLMRHLARNCSRQPLMLVVTYREVEIDEARAFYGALLDLQRERLATRLKLSRLDREGTRALIATLFDQEITPDLLEGYYRETEGNPFFIEEITKALVESGKLTFKEGRWHRPPIEELGIPQSIRVAVQARAMALSDEGRKILEQAAVLGRVFDLPTLEAATGLDEDALTEALEEALAAQLIEEEVVTEKRSAGLVAGEHFSFVHALIPASLVAGLRALRRRRLQRRAATAYESLHPEEYEVLARHFLEGGQIEKGVHYLLLAGDRARIQYAHEEAIDSYQSAIGYLKEEGQLEAAGRTLMKLGLAYNNAFEFARSRQAYQEGFALWQRASSSPTVESSQPAPHPLRLQFGEPKTLDPGLADDWTSGIYIENLFCGLVRLTAEMDIVPDVAHSWQVLDGEQRYRFHLRDDVVWSDGVPVTAGDFAFAWRRILTPANNSPLAEKFYTIKSGRDFYESKLKSWDDVGVDVVDALVLEVTLERPDSTFIYLVSEVYPLPEHRLQIPEATLMAWDELVTNGPFRLTKWEPDQSLRLAANFNYHGSRAGNLETVEVIVEDEYDDSGLTLYKNDLLDVVFPAVADVVQVRNRFAADHVSFPGLVVFYIAFDCTQAPFADPRVRRALALATDIESLSNIHPFSFPASGGVIPSGMAGHVPGIAQPYAPEEARRLLARAGYAKKGSFPPVKFLWRDMPGAEMLSDLLAVRWHEILGIETKIEFSPDSDPYPNFSRNRAESSLLYLGGLVAGFPIPEEFLGFNNFIDRTGWRNEAYERLIRQAGVMMEQEGRMGLYRQAQEILVEQTPLLPLLYGRISLLVKPWVRRFPTSPLHWHYWKDVVIEPH
ncbi:MAG TPA: ABC transporter substrate-binding protein [Anaerolineae bacterium]|nr:ABC transporter substrate-binding protein [Anaerolineae bacterium]